MVGLREVSCGAAVEVCVRVRVGWCGWSWTSRGCILRRAACQPPTADRQVSLMVASYTRSVEGEPLRTLLYKVR